MSVRDELGEPDVTNVKRGGRVSDGVRLAIWTRAAGRCHMCNAFLLDDYLSGKEDRKFGFIAHIIAEKENGPRGDRIRSPLLVNDPTNLMLLCYVHHKVIDDSEDEYPEERLKAIKEAHERRIAIVAAIDVDRASDVLRFGAKIGSLESPLSYEQLSEAMLPERYPARGRDTIDVEILGLALEDHEPDYWVQQRRNLERQFALKVHERVETRAIRHLSVFALAPQPLLILLGQLLGDILPADVRQLHREPKGWRWAESNASIALRMEEAQSDGGPVALVLALSAAIDPERVRAVLGPDVAIWTIEARDPHNDIIRSAADLRQFRELIRRTFNAIKARHGEEAVINMFPAVPVSAAVETGRAWMPKADLPLVLWDQNRKIGGFIRTLTIGADWL